MKKKYPSQKFSDFADIFVYSLFVSNLFVDAIVANHSWLTTIVSLKNGSISFIIFSIAKSIILETYFLILKYYLFIKSFFPQ